MIAPIQWISDRTLMRTVSIAMVRSLITFTLGMILLLSLETDAQSSPRLLSGPIQVNGDILLFRISPNSQRVIYYGDQDTNGVNELYSVRLDGTGRVKLNPPISASENVEDDFLISENSQYVVFRVSGSPDRLYSVPIAGGTAVQLDTSSLMDGPLHGTREFQITPNSSRVVFISDLIARGSTELFAVPIEGGTEPTQLTPTFPGPAPSGFPAFRISPDSLTVVFRSKLSFSGQQELFSVSINGGTHTKLNDSLAVNGEIEAFDGYFISSDSSKVVYLGEQDTPTSKELYSVPIAGGSTVKLNESLEFNTDVLTYLISPDGQTVVYQAKLDSNTLSHFYSVSIAGGASTQLSANPVSGGGLSIVGGKGQNSQVLISPDSLRMVYRARINDAGKNELYSVALEGGESIKLNAPLTAGEEVSALFSENNSFYRGYSLSKDGERVFYFADENEGGQLYSVPIVGGTPIKLTELALQSAIPPLLLEGANSNNLIYLSDLDLDSNIEIHGVRTSGTPLVDNLLLEDIASFFIGSSDRQLRATLSDDAQSLVYLSKDSSASDALQLFVIDGLGDTDDDGVFDALDNCPNKLNTDQQDNDGYQDGVGEGDACETQDDLCFPVNVTGESVALVCI